MIEIGGVPVLVNDHLPPPRPPSPAEDARRIVRHGLADVLAWLGESVGPEPGAPVHTVLVVGGRAMMRSDAVRVLEVAL